VISNYTVALKTKVLLQSRVGLVISLASIHKLLHVSASSLLFAIAANTYRHCIVLVATVNSLQLFTDYRFVTKALVLVSLSWSGDELTPSVVEDLNCIFPLSSSCRYVHGLRNYTVRWREQI